MTDSAIRSFVLRSFVESARPPSPEEIATDQGISVPDARGALERLAEAHVISFAPGSPYILMANPFSAVPTSFRVRSGDRAWWGNCVWDGLGILAMLELDGTVDTSCPDCGERLSLEVRDGGLVRDEGVVHFSVPAAKWWDDIGYT